MALFQLNTVIKRKTEQEQAIIFFTYRESLRCWYSREKNMTSHFEQLALVSQSRGVNNHATFFSALIFTRSLRIERRKEKTF